MSYDITLLDPVTKQEIQFDQKRHMAGGIYALGGTNGAWLNVTYNYSRFFKMVIDEQDGIRKIYGMTGLQSLPILENAISALKDDATDDYWEPTEGNAKRALIQLRTLAQMRPDGVWDGD
jgi:hypothetical protein